MDHRIPKTIIQTGKTKNLSIFEKACVANIARMNPDFEYLYFDNKEVDHFINTQPKKYQNAFYSFRYEIQKYDFFRYLAIYQYGGFYFDLDIILAESLEELLRYNCVFTFERITFNKFLRLNHKIDWEIGNYAFGAEPKHPFLHAIIENCIKSQIDKEWTNQMIKSTPLLFRNEAKVLCCTGPGMVTRTYAENNELNPKIKLLFPENIYDKKGWYHFGIYGTHIMKSTWRKNRSRLHNFIRNSWISMLEKKYHII